MHKNITKIYIRGGFRKEQHCSIDCYKAMGSIPQLQCKKCLYLYHHECADVPIEVAGSISFICKVLIAINRNRQ